MSNTQRSLDLLRKTGYVVAVVERFLSHAGPHGQRRDLFGLADVEAMNAEHTLYVQCCSASKLSDHVRKCLSIERPVRMVKGEPVEELSNYERLAMLVGCPVRRFEIWAWLKRKTPGSRQVWHVRRHRAVRDGASVVFVGVADPAPDSQETPSRRPRKPKRPAEQTEIAWSSADGSLHESGNLVKGSEAST